MNLALATGPFDVATLRAEMNELKLAINAGAPGLLNAQAGSVGNAADTTDDTLYSFIIAAGKWATLFPSAQPSGVQGIRITAWGTTAANGQNKTAKLLFGGTTLISTGVITTSAKGWMLRGIVLRTGVSTQKCLGEGVSDATPLSEAVADATETETSAITVKVTGASPTSGSAADVLGKGFVIEALR